MTNVIQFPLRLAPALMDFERRLIDRAGGRDIDTARLRRALERVQPLYIALSAPLAITIPDTAEDMAALQRLDEPLQRALVERLNQVVLAQLQLEIERSGG